jgi:hypothetical protein
LPFHGNRLNYCRCHCTHHNYTWWGCFIPPQWCSSAMIDASHSMSALFSLGCRFDISFRAPYCHFPRRSSSGMGALHTPPQPQIGPPLFHSRLLTSFHFWRCSAWMGCAAGCALLNPRWCSVAWIFAPQFHSTLRHHRQHSTCRPRTPHQPLLLSWWRTSFSPTFDIFAF